MSARLACRIQEKKMRALLAYELNSFSPGNPLKHSPADPPGNGAGSESGRAGPQPPPAGTAVTNLERV